MQSTSVDWSAGPRACDGSGNPGNPNACPTDINEDGTTNVADLLMVLGEFASECELTVTCPPA